MSVDTRTEALHSSVKFFVCVRTQDKQSLPMPTFFKGKETETEGGEDRKKMLPNMNLPIIDRTKLKGSLKCLKWIQKKVQKKGAAFPLFMILLNTVYLTLGGLIFMAVERQPKIVVNTSQELVEIFDVLKVSFNLWVWQLLSRAWAILDRFFSPRLE